MRHPHTSLNSEHRRVLIISRDIAGAERLAQAVQPNVGVVWYSSEDHLASLQSRIEGVTQGHEVSSIGLAAHGGAALSTSPLWKSLEDSSSKASAFWRWLGQQLTSEGYLDILNCGLAQGTQGEKLFKQLEQLSGHPVAARLTRRVMPLRGIGC